jgi:hypothetical protein
MWRRVEWVSENMSSPGRKKKKEKRKRKSEHGKHVSKVTCYSWLHLDGSIVVDDTYIQSGRAE